MKNKSSNKYCVFLVCVVLTLTTIVAFEPVRHNDFVDLDDRAYVTENPNVNDGISYESVLWAFTASHFANWHPLTWLSHMLDYHLFGLTYARLGKYDLAIQNLKQALQLRPKYHDAMNSLAWFLATAEDKKLQNPKDAVNLAQRACRLTEYRQPYLLDTLAVAYAAAGRFSQAIETAEKVINLAEAAGQRDKAREIRNRMKFYKEGWPYIGPLPKRLQPID